MNLKRLVYVLLCLSTVLSVIIPGHCQYEIAVFFGYPSPEQPWVEKSKNIGREYLLNPEPVEINVPVVTPEKKGFVLGATPLTLSMGTAGDAILRTVQLAVQTYGGYAGTINLQASELPTGLSASINPTQLVFTSDVTLKGATLTCQGFLSEGAYSFKITASDSTTSSQVTITLKVSKEETRPDETRGLIATMLQLSLSSQSVSPKASVTVKGTLIDGSQNRLAAKPILLTSDFDWSQTATTNSLGQFEVTFTAPEKTGIYSLNAEFKASGSYAGDKRAITFEVKQNATPLDWWWLALIVIVLAAILLLKWLFGSGGGGGTHVTVAHQM